LNSVFIHAQLRLSSIDSIKTRSPSVADRTLDIWSRTETDSTKVTTFVYTLHVLTLPSYAIINAEIRAADHAVNKPNRRTYG